MKIVHLCLQSTYNDYWGYQDNLLPKYHRKQGNEVIVITNNRTFGKEKKIEKVEAGEHTLNDGQRIIRIKHKPEIMPEVLSYYKIYNLLCKINPDFIMVHGLTNFSVLQVAKYLKKNKDCIAIADNHLDYNITSISKKTKIAAVYRKILKILNKYMQKYYAKIYGVTPWRIDFANEVFGIKKEKLDLLVMGGDDEKIHLDKKEEIKKEIRNKYNIKQNDFLIITGGKIDTKKNIHLLIDAFIEVQNPNLKLLIFGQADDKKMEEKIKNQCKIDDRIQYIGWIDSNAVYDYFLASDVAIFPGQHSVLWEQVCACGIPIVTKYWTRMDHFDVGGNCKFIYNDTVEEIKEIIIEISNKEKSVEMKKVAEEKGIKLFSYNQIAEKALETINYK